MTTVVLTQDDGTVVVLTSSGPPGANGEVGLGVPPGGTTAQVLVKLSDADYDTAWVTVTVNPTTGELDFSDPDNSGLIGH